MDNRAQVREFLASRRALQLDDAERDHLFDLARGVPAEVPAPRG